MENISISCVSRTASFERIWTEFDMWHRYTLRLVMMVSD